jgi:hypothetical protein
MQLLINEIGIKPQKNSHLEVIKAMLNFSAYTNPGTLRNKSVIFLALLLLGFGSLSAHADKKSPAHSSYSEYFRSLAIQNGQASYIKRNEFCAKKQTEQFNVLLCEKEEEEEDESLSSKKFLEISNYSIFLSGAYTFDCLLNNTRKVSPSNKCVPYSSSHQYLLFRVFRI